MRKLSFLILSLLAAQTAFAASADDVGADQPYVRLAPPGAPATGAFMVLRNAGDKPARVVKADSPAAKVTELHNHINDNGVMKMRPVPAIDIPPKGQAELKPGSLHIMLIDLKAAMKEGDSVPITLNFDDGSSRKIDAKVVRPTPAPAAMEHRH